jgi:hypothetical protein
VLLVRYRGVPVVLFGFAWFWILLAPLLPLRDHVSDYYLTGPVIGLALAAAWAVRHSRLAAAFVAIYLATSLPVARIATLWNHDRAEAVRDFVTVVATARDRAPGQPILLSGVTTDLFEAAVAHLAFPVLGMPHVYLTPGSETAIASPPDRVRPFVLPEGLARRLLDEGRARVYEVGAGGLRNVTSRHRIAWRAGPPDFVNPGDPLFEDQLTGDWLAPKRGYRAMGRRAMVRLAAGSTLRIGVFCREPVTLEVSIDGSPATPLRLERCDGIRILSLLVAPSGGEQVEVTLRAGVPGVSFGFLATDPQRFR